MKRFFRKVLLGCSIIAGFVFLVFFGNKIGSYFFPVNETPRIIVKEGKIEKNSSLYLTLNKHFPVSETVQVGSALSKLYDVKKVKTGDQYKIYHSTSQKILKFIFIPSPLVNYIVDRSSTEFIVSKLVPDIDEKTVAVKGSISSSLYEGMVKCGINVRTIMNFADIFQWQIDFFTDVMPGDKFLIVFNQYFVEGQPVDDGQIILAGYKGRYGQHTAIRFKDGSRPSYYDAQGQSFRKQFLKAPLRFKRISSHFSYRRKHPILKYVRPHLGIDYAAPMGTPVSTIGSGKVIYKGWKGGFGRTVIIRHNSIYTTQYGHLKSYARGIKKGAYVKQGDDIGYVGSSGLSTGPHLDFRINKYGKPVNFLKLKLPAAKSVSKKNKEKFKEKVKRSRYYLECLESELFNSKIFSIEDYEKMRDNAVHKTQLPQ